MSAGVRHERGVPVFRRILDHEPVVSVGHCAVSDQWDAFVAYFEYSVAICPSACAECILRLQSPDDFETVVELAVTKAAEESVTDAEVGVVGRNGFSG